jgi:dihydrofolate reductase
MPRQVIGAAFMSLDGVIQAPGAPEEDRSGGFPYGGWWQPQFDDTLDEALTSLFARPFDLLLGRRTYDIFSAYWPFMPADGDIASVFNRVNKYVLTRADKPMEWRNSQRLADLDELAALKSGEGPDLLIQGSSTLYPQLLAGGLLDRLHLMIGPVVLGSGKRLFDGGEAATAMRLVSQTVSPKGVITAIYDPAGPVRTGSFSDGRASQPELARRRLVEQGVW